MSALESERIPDYDIEPGQRVYIGRVVAKLDAQQFRGLLSGPNRQTISKPAQPVQAEEVKIPRMPNAFPDLVKTVA